MGSGLRGEPLPGERSPGRVSSRVRSSDIPARSPHPGRTSPAPLGSHVSSSRCSPSVAGVCCHTRKRADWISSARPETRAEMKLATPKAPDVAGLEGRDEQN